MCSARCVNTNASSWQFPFPDYFCIVHCAACRKSSPFTRTKSDKAGFFDCFRCSRDMHMIRFESSPPITCQVRSSRQPLTSPHSLSEPAPCSLNVWSAIAKDCPCDGSLGLSNFQQSIVHLFLDCADCSNGICTVSQFECAHGSSGSCISGMA